MPGVLRQVRHTIATHNLLDAGDGVVVGVSGGPDSLCLLHVLERLREPLQLRLHVAHLNHRARGEAADADAEFVARTAADWNLPVTVDKQDVPAMAEEHGLAFEETARRARYAFLARVALENRMKKIAVGHNADDQAETVLMHFLRGAGLAGLRGMLPLTPIGDYRLLHPFAEQEMTGESRKARSRKEEAGSEQVEEAKRSPRIPHPGYCIIRPLLKVRRSDIEHYCAEHGLTPRFDRSNLDTTYFRNRLRHELLPLLEDYNPNIRERLCHTADVVAADYELLSQLREQAWDEITIEEREDAIVFDQTDWRALPVAMQRSVLRQAAYRLRRSLRDVTFVHIKNAREIALRGETGSQATLPMGLALTVGYDTLIIGDIDEAGPPPDEPLLWTDEPLPVPVPGTAPLPESEWTLEADVLTQWDMTEVTAPAHPWTAYLDADALSEPLLLRTRRRGERFHPHGMGGHTVKVSDLMINLKIPEAWRDHVPLLVAGGDIAWVCGRRIAQSVAVTPETQRVAVFRFERTT